MSAVLDFSATNNKESKRQPRRSKGCLTCRKRKVKCDERRPICERCHKGFHPCEYSQKFIFVIDPPVITTNTQCPVDKPNSLVSSKSQQTQSISVSVPPTLGLEGFQDDIIISFLVAKLFVKVQSPPDDEFSITRLLLWNRDSTGYLSGLCLAEALFSSIHHLNDMKSHASQLYGTAVARLKVELAGKEKTPTSLPHVTIWSAVFLGIYEMVSSDSMSNWLKHCHGVAALMQMAGPYGFQRNAAKSIFQINRSFVSIGAMADRERTFLEQDVWKLIPWARDPMSKTIAERLQDILCDVPGLMEDVDNITKYQHRGSSFAQITSKLRSCFDDLDTLRMSWNYVYADSFWEATELSRLCSEVNKDQRSPFDSVLAFSNLEQAIEFVYFNTTHLLLHSILRQLRSTNNTDAFGMDLFSLPNLDDQDDCILTFRNHDERHHNALLVCRCVEYMTQNECGASGAFNLLFPLKVGYRHLSGSSDIQKWIVDVMERISSTKGLFIGTQILTHY